MTFKVPITDLLIGNNDFFLFGVIHSLQIISF